MSSEDEGGPSGAAGSDGDELQEFRCRKCPGKTFTAAEKDAHRAFHKKQKKDKKRKPGPASRTRKSPRHERSPSPAHSDTLTLFERLEQAPDVQPRQSAQRQRGRQGRRKPEAPAQNPPPNKKRKSNKSYQDNVIGEWVNGNGA